MSCLPSIARGSTGHSHLYLHSEEAVSMTLAHRTPDAGSAKVGGGALWIGIHVTLKTPRAISFTVTPVLTLLRAKCYDFRAAFDLPQPDEKRTVAKIKILLPLADQTKK